MKIIIREKGGRSLRIVLPSAFLLNGFSAWIAASVLRKKGMDVTKEQLEPMLRGLRRFRKACPDWKLVEMRERDGDSVEICL